MDSSPIPAGQRFTPIGQPIMKVVKEFESDLNKPKITKVVSVFANANIALVFLGLFENTKMQPFGSSKAPKKQLLPLRADRGDRKFGHQQREEPTVSEYSMEYLAELLKEKKQLDVFPQVFRHIERLVEDEIGRVRSALFQCHFSLEQLNLPEPEGDLMTIQEKVYVPHKEHPDYNFVGRILGPRGMTAKQLEQETGCKIMVRGRGSMRDRRKEEQNRGKPNWEHLEDELHVLVQCEDTSNRVYIKLKSAVDQIKKLLVPAPEGTDELKRKQLMELAIINGTYRPVSKYPIRQSFSALPNHYAAKPPRIMPMTIVSPIRHASTLPAQPIFVSPAGSPITPGTNISAPSNVNAYMQSPNIDYNMMMNHCSQLSFDALTSFPMAGDYQPHMNTFPTATSLLNAAASSNNNPLQSFFVESNPITPPESTGSNRR